MLRQLISRFVCVPRACLMFVCLGQFGVAAIGCAGNSAEINADMEPSEIQEIVNENFAAGMPQFEVDKRLDRIGLDAKWHKEGDERVGAAMLLPGGIFETAPGWEKRQMHGELLLYLDDEKLSRAEYVRQWPESDGGRRDTTPLTLPQSVK